MKAALTTLGCKVNSYDTDCMREVLRKGGYAIVDFDDLADVYIINSCTVTGTGDKKSRQMVSRARRKNPDAIICMAGCYAQTAPLEVEALGVDLVIGTSGRDKLCTLIEQARGGQVRWVEDKLDAFEDLSSGTQDERTRGLIKIQDGCERFCTYCIIPYARGKSRSRKPESILEEAKKLAREGNREVVLTGIHLASYGKDGGGSLLSVIRQVASLAGIERVRLGSLEPSILTKTFTQALTEIPAFCPAFHVSLQSGCNRTLKAMGRRYTREEYAAYVENVRRAFPGCAVTTDVMVGFPGESRGDFLDSLAFVRQIGFSRVHVFPYSRRPGTPAAKMSGQVEKAEKSRRVAEMMEAAKEGEAAYTCQFFGATMEVLFEQEVEKNLFSGYTKNYLKVYAKGVDLHNQILSVRLLHESKDGVMGELY